MSDSGGHSKESNHQRERDNLPHCDWRGGCRTGNLASCGRFNLTLTLTTTQAPVSVPVSICYVFGAKTGIYRMCHQLT